MSAEAESLLAALESGGKLYMIPLPPYKKATYRLRRKDRHGDFGGFEDVEENAVAALVKQGRIYTSATPGPHGEHEYSILPRKKKEAVTDAQQQL